MRCSAPPQRAAGCTGPAARRTQPLLAAAARHQRTSRPHSRGPAAALAPPQRRHRRPRVTAAAAPSAATGAADASPADAGAADAVADADAARLLAPAPGDAALIDSLLATPLPDLMREAARLRDEGHPRVVTFSPKVFIPLTRLCRDACGYCTFALPPAPGRRAFMTLGEVVAVARLGAAQGCAEALFTLGDKPEDRWPEAAAELRSMGYPSTLDYVAAAAAEVLRETGLLPHVNAGIVGEADAARLREVSASQGLMLESLSPRLAAPGGAHHGCPDKEAAPRLGALAAAGRVGVPFTTGILVGIGETRRERVEALLAIKRAHAEWGHVQEVIVQNFRAKPGTAMAAHPEPPLEELLWSVAAARVVLGAGMSVQAPPNLTPAAEAGEEEAGEAWRALIDAGINDWGGISPVTRDFVNPERPWPHLERLAAATAAAGKLLLPRLPVYPRYLLHPEPGRWLAAGGGASSIGGRARAAADGDGLLRGSRWFAGAADAETKAGDGDGAAARPRGEGGSGGAAPSGAAALSGAAASAAPPAGRPASPAPRTRPGAGWSIAVGPSGTLEGAAAPAEPQPEVAALLERILSGASAGASGREPGAPAAPRGRAPPRGAAATLAAARAAAAPAEAAHATPSEAARAGVELSEAEVALLLRARGADFDAVVAAADELRARVCGDEVTYVVNRNINYTNVCTYSCSFCAFSKGKGSEDLRGTPYLVPLEEITRRAAEAWDRGATEVCMQGGIHPDFTGDTYLRLLDAAKAGAPGIHVHAFSPLEVLQGARTLGLGLDAYLARLRSAGLGSLPGTAAEVLDDAVRATLCPDKLTTAEWLSVARAAHGAGLPTTSTLMFGHVEEDAPGAWARHLLALRALAAGTGGVSEFVPLPFVHMQAPVFLRGGARRGPTLRECVLAHAVARLVLHPHITNIQASWVKMGPERAAALLAAGCNDMGGSLMSESITKAAGAAHGQELTPGRMEALIRAAGRAPRQRTTLYGAPPPGQVARSFGAAPLAPAAAVRAGAGAAAGGVRL
ncbi:hypothetical protein Rsub_11212 [Raphidocelis subcapitata]|uniref:FO synthase n=1 Tax=Raphidocelis subcapitata TaxID=307507 RepID=A0A2V0PFS7_9CHLO|nr:hypothetical protein Rsub_11212 [Raphidocelis subcapitata]|eukprot:GBF97862.1 hypothetical protein Rsub_11212 [Raphidocelis subcapitata]